MPASIGVRSKQYAAKAESVVSRLICRGLVSLALESQSAEQYLCAPQTTIPPKLLFSCDQQQGRRADTVGKRTVPGETSVVTSTADF